MLVRQLVGRFAGKIIEMPFHIAQACLANGTAGHPEAPVRVRGLDAEGKPSLEGRTAENVGTDRMMRDYPTAGGALKFLPVEDKVDTPAETDPTDALRAEYEQLSGEQADGRWGEPRLRKEIKKLKG